MRALKDRVLSESELFQVLADLKRRAKRSKESQQTLVLYRLAVCCALRPGEIANLQLRDVRIDGRRPTLEVCQVRTRNGKITRKSRVVDLDFDDDTRKDIVAWRLYRYQQAEGDRFAPLICGQREANLGKPLNSKTLGRRWKAAIRCLGPERARQLSISAGRHSCAVQLFRRGVKWPAVQHHLGLPSIYDTTRYSDLVPGLRGGPGRVFSL